MFDDVSDCTQIKLKSVHSVMDTCFGFYGQNTAYVDLNAGPGIYKDKAGVELAGGAIYALAQLPTKSVAYIIDKDSNVLSELTHNISALIFDRKSMPALHIVNSTNLDFVKALDPALLKSKQGLIYADGKSTEQEIEAVEILTKETGLDTIFHILIAPAKRTAGSKGYEFNLIDRLKSLPRRFKCITPSTMGRHSAVLFFATDCYELKAAFENNPIINQYWGKPIDVKEFNHNQVEFRTIATDTIGETAEARTLVTRPRKADKTPYKKRRSFLTDVIESIELDTFSLIDLQRAYSNTGRVSTAGSLTSLGSRAVKLGLITRVKSGVYKKTDPSLNEPMQQVSTAVPAFATRSISWRDAALRLGMFTTSSLAAFKYRVPEEKLTINQIIATRSGIRYLSKFSDGIVISRAKEGGTNKRKIVYSASLLKGESA